MHFTVVFPSQESKDWSFSLLFVPSPVWQCHKTTLLNLHPEYPHYKKGDFKSLLKKIQYPDLDEANTKIALVIHPSGHGSDNDLRKLRSDISKEGFQANEVDLRIL